MLDERLEVPELQLLHRRGREPLRPLQLLPIPHHPPPLEHRLKRRQQHMTMENPREVHAALLSTCSYIASYLPTIARTSNSLSTRCRPATPIRAASSGSAPILPTAAATPAASPGSTSSPVTP